MTRLDYYNGVLSKLEQWQAALGYWTAEELTQIWVLIKMVRDRIEKEG